MLLVLLQSHWKTFIKIIKIRVKTLFREHYWHDILYGERRNKRHSQTSSNQKSSLGCVPGLLFLVGKNHVQLLRKQMEKEAFKNITDGRVCMTDSEEVRAYRGRFCCTPHLSGRWISGICLVWLESNKCEHGNAQSDWEQKDRSAYGVRATATAQDRAGSRLEE